MLQAWTTAARCRAGGEQNAGSGLNPTSAVGHSRDAPYFWFRNPERAGQMIFLRLAGRADWLYGLLQNLCDKRGDTTVFDEYWKKTPMPSCTTFIGKTSSISQPVLACRYFGRQPLP